MTTDLDHLAIGTPALTDGWELFGGLLGGTWAYGGDSPGYWWGQLEFASGPKITIQNVDGNHIIQDLGGGVWAMYAHLIKGSLLVTPGTRSRRARRSRRERSPTRKPPGCVRGRPTTRL